MGRAASASGFISVILLLAAFAIFAVPGGGDDQNARYASDLSEDGQQMATLIAVHLGMLAVLAFGWFALHLVGRFADAGSGRQLAEGQKLLIVGASVLLFAAFAAFAVAPLSARAGGDPQPFTAEVARFAWLGEGLVYGAAYTLSALIATVSVAILRTHAFPTWTAWAGFVCAVMLLFAILWITMIALPIWIAILSGVLWLRSDNTRPALAHKPATA